MSDETVQEPVRKIQVVLKSMRLVRQLVELTNDESLANLLRNWEKNLETAIEQM